MRNLGLALVVALAGCATSQPAAVETVYVDLEEVHEDGEGPYYAREGKAIRFAVEILLEIGRGDSAHLVEQSWHARELAVDGRTGEDAMHIRRTAPTRGQMIELLTWSGNLLQEHGKEDRAHEVHWLSEHLWEQHGEGAPAKRKKHARTDREHLTHQIEVLDIAQKALLEADKKHWAEVIEHAKHARELRQEGRTDDEAVRIMETSPGKEDVVELLRWAADWLGAHDMPDRAEWCDRMAEQMMGEGRKEAHRERDSDRNLAEHLERALHRIEQLEERINHMAHAMERMQDKLEGLRK